MFKFQLNFMLMKNNFRLFGTAENVACLQMPWKRSQFYHTAYLRVGIIGLLRLGGGGGTPDSLADCSETSSTDTTF